MEPVLDFLTANGIGKVRRETLHGRAYLVAPMTTIVPGVLSGSRGALYYPPDQVARNVKQWDDLPLVCYHPMDPSGGHVSASSPGVVDRQGLGFVKGSTFNGKLQHEAWFDEDRVRQIDNTLLSGKPEAHILPRLLRNEVIGLSTGLYTDNQPAPLGSHHNGVPYDFVAENYRGDHVAVLPDQVGACSVEDGCGILLNRLVENSDVPNSDVPNSDAPRQTATATATAQPPPAASPLVKKEKKVKPVKAIATGSAESAARSLSFGKTTSPEPTAPKPVQNSKPKCPT